jgi:hypothetical protein
MNDRIRQLLTNTMKLDDELVAVPQVQLARMRGCLTSSINSSDVKQAAGDVS